MKYFSYYLKEFLLPDQEGYEDNSFTKMMLELKESTKKSSKKEVARDLISLFKDRILELNEKWNIDLIVPVPGSHDDINSTTLLAVEVGQLLNKDICENTLIRKNRTKIKKQKSVQGFRERLKNVEDTFMINKRYLDKIVKKNILLIDDVVVSGTTQFECQKVLYVEGQCEKIISLAMGMIPTDMKQKEIISIYDI